MTFELLLWGLLIYFAYRFIFGFLLPIGKATRQMRQKMQEMQQAVHQQQEAQHQTTTQATQHKQSPVEGDYIEFEEVK